MSELRVLYRIRSTMVRGSTLNFLIVKVLPLWVISFP